jgi:LemA protein
VDIALIVIAVLLVLIGDYFALTYNKLVGLRNRVETVWSQIDVQLKRRYDLIPNLVETVRGYASRSAATSRSKRSRARAGSRRMIGD